VASSVVNLSMVQTAHSVALRHEEGVELYLHGLVLKHRQTFNLILVIYDPAFITYFSSLRWQCFLWRLLLKYLYLYSCFRVNANSLHENVIYLEAFPI